MARSNAERQAAWQKRRNAELVLLRQRVHELEGELDIADAKLRAAKDMLPLSKTATAQEIVAGLTGELSGAKLAQVWLLLGERLKATTPRVRQSEAPAPRQSRNLAQYLYPSPRRET